MRAIYYKQQKPGQITQAGRVELVPVETVQSLTDNLVSTFQLDDAASFSHSLAVGDVAIVGAHAYVVKLIDGSKVSLVDIVNHFKAPYLTTGTAVTPNAVSLGVAIIENGIARTQNGGAFEVGVTALANSVTIPTALTVDSSKSTNDPVMADVPSLWFNVKAASVGEYVLDLIVSSFSFDHIVLAVDVRHTINQGLRYTEGADNRGAYGLTVNDKLIDYNSALVSSITGDESGVYYLNEDGTISTTLPDWIQTIQQAGLYYDPTTEQSSPAQLAKGQLPTSQGSNFQVSITNGSTFDGLLRVGDSLSIFENGRTLKGTLTTATTTSDGQTLTFGFSNPRLVLNI